MGICEVKSLSFGEHVDNMKRPSRRCRSRGSSDPLACRLVSAATCGTNSYLFATFLP